MYQFDNNLIMGGKWVASRPAAQEARNAILLSDFALPLEELEEILLVAESLRETDHEG